MGTGIFLSWNRLGSCEKPIFYNFNSLRIFLAKPKIVLYVSVRRVTPVINQENKSPAKGVITYLTFPMILHCGHVTCASKT